MYSGHISLASFAVYAFLAVATSASPIPSLTEHPASVSEANWAKYTACIANVGTAPYPDSVEDCALVLSDASAANAELYEFKA
ncbi:hypothetical protein G7Y89_g6467 [Cudoniella acicularis]|uniref:Uncharacterized protein n=1 Tax=Cudoniella acicularis TaxID=354080 RepID=A0A8H4W5H2_9HELO|nr:hypothetical protein G7Y89_g6467 [Cudoniella acicularis]